MPQIDWSQLGAQVGIAIGALVAGYIAYLIVFIALRRLADRTKSALDDSVARNFAAPVSVIFPLLGLDIVLPSLKVPAAIDDPIRHVVGIALIAAVAWLVIRTTHVLEDVIVQHFRIDVRDNLKARQIRTQFEVFRRVAEFAVFVIALGIALTTFDWAKTIGTSVLASAGIVGLAASLAARPTIENLVAGLQIALTEPIRLEDVVIADNEWGWIEEITTTYVVLRVWDLRRVVLPLTYFIKTPFQNWTRQSADLLQYVTLNFDYTMPIEPLRAEFTRILANSSRWDKKVNVLQVINADDHTLQVRALASASDSGSGWDLKCEILEKLLAFAQKNYPQCLPRSRNELPEIHARVLPENGAAHNPHPAER
jgi:small-conductance mechanosensitive channel